MAILASRTSRQKSFMETIIEEYINFCRVYDAQRDIHKNDMEPQKGIAETVDICIEKGKYLMEHRAEVEKIMYNPEYVKEREQLSRIYGWAFHLPQRHSRYYAVSS